MSSAKQSVPAVMEHYGSQKDAGRTFDRQFWQTQGDEAIFEAARDMVLDYLLLKHGHVDEPRLDRSIESIRRA